MLSWRPKPAHGRAYAALHYGTTSYSVLTILVMSIIVFSLARVTGNPLDVLLPLEATPEDYERVAKHWAWTSHCTCNTSCFCDQSCTWRFWHVLEVAGPFGHGSGGGTPASHP